MSSAIWDLVTGFGVPTHEQSMMRVILMAVYIRMSHFYWVESVGHYPLGL